MHCIQSPRLRRRAVVDSGSQVVGFALVAPLLLMVALMLMQVVSIVICSVSLDTSVKQAAHLAATKGSSPANVYRAAVESWKPAGYSTCGKKVSTKRTVMHGVSFVTVNVSICLDIPILNQQVNMSSSAREIDEAEL